MTRPDARSRLLHLLRSIALERGHFVLASGRTSDFYLDCRRVTLDPEGSLLVGKLFFRLLSKDGAKVKGVGGMTLGADPIVTAVCLVSQLEGRPLSGFLVRKEQKGHGTGKWIEKGGRLKAGAPVAIAEDVVTSGGSLLRAVERANDEGLRVVRALAIVDRGEGGAEAIAAAKLKLESLFSIREVLA